MTRQAANPQSSIPLLLTTLKGLLRARGLRYVDIARSLGVSEMTVKRYLSGRGLSIAVLERLCGLAGIDVLELSELASQSVPSRDEPLSEAQETALAEQHGLAVILHLILAGWTPRNIQAELELAEHELIASLVQLDRLGFIDLLPENKVRLRSIRQIDWAHNARLKASFGRYLKEHFRKDFADPEVLWRYALVKLSEPSLRRLEVLLQECAQAVHALARDDQDLPADQRRWHGVLLAAQPVELSEMRASSVTGAPGSTA